MQRAFLPVYILLALIVIAHAQWRTGANFEYGSKGSSLKLSIGRDVGRWNFKGFGSTDFRGGWSAGVGVGIRFKRSAGEISSRYEIVIVANQCHFDVYDENNDGVITKEEMVNLFEDETLGSNLFDDLHTDRGQPGITKPEFYKMAPSVIKGCVKDL